MVWIIVELPKSVPAICKRAKAAVPLSMHSAVDARWLSTAAADAGVEKTFQNCRKIAMDGPCIVLTGPECSGYHPAMIVPKLRLRQAQIREDSKSTTPIANEITEVDSGLELNH